MDLFLITAAILLAFEAVYNSWEFLVVYRVRKDKAKFIEAHSPIGEGSELVVFILASILFYLSDFNIILTGITIALGIWHVPGTFIKKDRILKMSEDMFRKFPYIIMLACAIEVVLSIYLITTVIPLL